MINWFWRILPPWSFEFLPSGKYTPCKGCIFIFAHNISEWPNPIYNGFPSEISGLVKAKHNIGKGTFVISNFFPLSRMLCLAKVKANIQHREIYEKRLHFRMPDDHSPSVCLLPLFAAIGISHASWIWKTFMQNKKFIINTDENCCPNSYFPAFSGASVVPGNYQQSDVKVPSMSYLFFHFGWIHKMSNAISLQGWEII